MAYIEFDSAKFKHNYTFLDRLFRKYDKEWSIVTKLLCGNKSYLKQVLDSGIKEVCDSRISNLKEIKDLNPEIGTVYIKPPAKRSIKSVVQYADVSFNTELSTIKLLNNEALRQNKVHRIIIMIEMGDLREGVMGSELIEFYGEIFNLPGIEVSGIGTNLNCLNGVLPSQDKLIQLSLYEQLIEAKFDKKIPFVTGGTSVIIPLLRRHQVPEGINHFRVGETLFFGNDLITNKLIKGMKQDVIKLFAEIIEISEKPVVPIGQLGENPSGEAYDLNEEDYGKTALRAIIDIGLLDITTDFIQPKDSKIEIVGASSDMIIVDITNCRKKYKVGDLIEFRLKYMGALGLMNSDYISKHIV